MMPEAVYQNFMMIFYESFSAKHLQLIKNDKCVDNTF